MNLHKQKYSIENYREYWLNSLISNNYGYDKDLERAFWQDAGFDEYRLKIIAPVRMAGMGKLIEDYYAAIWEELNPRKNCSSIQNNSKYWVDLAHATGVLTDELLDKICEISPNVWSYNSSIIIGKKWENVILYRFDNIEPKPGTPEAMHLEHMVTLSAKVERCVNKHMMSFSPHSHAMLRWMNHTGMEVLVIACQHIEKLQITSLTVPNSQLPHQHEALAKMAASDFTLSDAEDLESSLKVFSDHTLILVEEFSEAGRPVIRDILQSRTGCRELLVLRDVLRNLLVENAVGFLEFGAASGELNAHDFLRLIATIPQHLFDWYIATFDDKAPQSMILQALMGKNQKKLLASIRRHSQMALKSYALLPLPRESGKKFSEVCERYMLIEEFVKGSKKFGSERQANNKICAEVALSNLALNAGYDDADELFFDIESRMSEEIVGTVVKSGGYEISIAYSGDGPYLQIMNGDKPLKAVPPALKKNSDYQKLHEQFLSLATQSKRFRRALEKRMALSSQIQPKQLASMWRAPILREMLSRLVFSDEDEHVGLLNETGSEMIAVCGRRFNIENVSLRIAHPVLLERLGNLPAWREYCFVHELVQPFRQIFREFYMITPAEIQSSPISLRFANHLLATSPLSGLMKARGWNTTGIDYPVPRKFFNGRNIVAFLDVNECGHYLTETKTLISGTVHFENVAKEKQPIESIPETIFSEVMRDVDLFVSIAQTTESIVPSKEMIAQRIALLTALIKKLKIKGVTQEGDYAIIQGRLSIYHVHLATGAVYLGKGKHLCIIPAETWKKPKSIFLPFYADDDIRIAEVFSKIMLLCHDDKIKDESILSQISNS